MDGKLFQAVNGICLVQKLKSWRSWLDGPFNLRLLADDILFNDCSNAFAPWDAWYPRESWALIAILRSWFSLRCPSSSKNVYDLGLSLVNMISPIEKPNTTKREKNILKSKYYNIEISIDDMVDKRNWKFRPYIKYEMYKLPEGPSVP